MASTAYRVDDPADGDDNGNEADFLAMALEAGDDDDEAADDANNEAAAQSPTPVTPVHAALTASLATTATAATATATPPPRSKLPARVAGAVVGSTTTPTSRRKQKRPPAGAAVSPVAAEAESKRAAKAGGGRRRVVRELWKAVGKACVVRGSLYKALPSAVALLGLVLAFAMEVLPQAPRYNVAVLGVLAGYRHLGLSRKSIRPQIVIALTALGSLVLDIVQMVSWSNRWTFVATDAVLLTLLPAVAAAKAVALTTFLRRAPGTGRARKYLVRRFRLFFIPLHEPRRVMRDIRARILAIGWVSLAAVVVYAGLFVVAVVAFSYAQLFNAGRYGITLSGFLVLKTVSSAVVLAGVLYDADVVLCLGYFGCLAFACGMAYLKSYTRRQKEKLGGWPHAFAFNELRFKVLAFFKLVDFGIGLVGCFHLSNLFGVGFFSQPDAMKAFVSLILLALAVTDWWGWVLFASVFWLHGRLEEAALVGELDNSDDSELDELGVRGTLAPSGPVARKTPNRSRANREAFMRESGYSFTGSVKKKVRQLFARRGRDEEEGEDGEVSSPLRGGRAFPWTRRRAQYKVDDDDDDDSGDDDDDDDGASSSSGGSSYSDEERGGDDGAADDAGGNNEIGDAEAGSAASLSPEPGHVHVRVAKRKGQQKDADTAADHHDSSAAAFATAATAAAAAAAAADASPLRVTADHAQFATTRREAESARDHLAAALAPASPLPPPPPAPGPPTSRRDAPADQRFATNRGANRPPNVPRHKDA